MYKTLAKLSLGLVVASLSFTAVGAVLEEVIVTAQKRTESLQDVPISVTPISGELIQDASIRSFNELGAYVPNFHLSENPVNTSMTLRGSSIGANQSFEQSVGIFVDGVHYGRGRQSRLGLFDLEQIEVLRGPQGILFGKNTLSGAINVTTAAPKVGEGLSGRIAGSFESDNGKYFEGHVSTSLSDTLAVRLSGMKRSIDGYVKNTAPNANLSDMPTLDEQIFRIGVQWTPSEQTNVGLRYTSAEFIREGAMATVSRFQPLPNAPATNLAMFATMAATFPNFAPSEDDAYRDAISVGGTESLNGGNGAERLEGTDTTHGEFSLNIDHEFANGLSLNLVTGHSEYEYSDGIDADFLPVQFIGRSDDSDFEAFFQEARLSSDEAARFSWVLGANYIETTQEIDRSVTFDGTLGQPNFMRVLTCPAPQLLGACGLPTFINYTPQQLQALTGGAVPFGVEGVSMFSQSARVSNWKQDTESFAVFAQGTFDISESLQLTAGLRYVEESKEATARTDLTTGAFGLDNPIPPAANPLFHGVWAASFATWAHAFDEERDTDELLSSVSLKWSASDDHLFYVSYAEGFKTGGFNAADDQVPVFLPDGTILRDQPGAGFEYEDETAWSVEVGGKHTFLDGALRINWAAFNTENEDEQVSTFVGLGFVVTNAASSESQGLEIDAAWQLTEKLRANLAVGFLDAEYTSYPGAGCTAMQQDALRGLNNAAPGGTLTPSSPVISAMGCEQQFLGSGQTSSGAQDLTGAPLFGADYSGSFGLEYNQPLGSMTWFTQIDVNFTDDRFMTGTFDPIDIQEGYELVNLRTGLRGDNWMLMLYGRNVTDEEYATGAAVVPLAAGAHMRYQARTQVWGVQAAWNF